MAVIEQSGLMKYKDQSGNVYLMLPITNADNVDGLEELIDEAKIVGKGVITAGDSAAYTATVAGITALESGFSFIMIPHVTSTTVSPTLNVNGLGAKTLKTRVSGSTATTVAAATTNWLGANMPVRVTYDGQFWIAEMVRPNADDIYGTVKIENGGTGATTAEQARINLGITTDMVAVQEHVADATIHVTAEEKQAWNDSVLLKSVTAALPTSAAWQSVTYGDGKFVAVAYRSNKAAYSNDGITWTQTTLPTSTTWQSVTYGNGKFVAVAYDSNIAAYSNDGITWTQTTLPASTYWCSVTYGNGKFVAVTNGNNIAAYSNDGINWTQTTLPASVRWISVNYGNDKFVAVASGTNVAAYSEDGINWATELDVLESVSGANVTDKAKKILGLEGEYTESEIQTMWDSVKVVTLVTFTITDPFEVGGPTGSFTAERGMTLTEWLASSYNTSHVPASFEHDTYGTVTLSGVDENYIKEGSSFEWTI